MQKFSDMAGVQYIASDPVMEQMAVARYMTNELYGEMPLQIGACFGRNLKMNALEYNKEISLCEAGVGIGKTLAYFVACILPVKKVPLRPTTA